VVNNKQVYATTVENEGLYTRKDLNKARLATEFLRNAGYPTEKEAVRLVEDGNVTNILIMGQDIQQAFQVYSKPVEAVRGKTTKTAVA
jgi:hypothetical protein